ncbi:MAG: post-COAP-1 domain-containing protein, partial [Nitrososphaerales archaeon]
TTTETTTPATTETTTETTTPATTETTTETTTPATTETTQTTTTATTTTTTLPITEGKITGGGAQVSRNTNFGFNVQSDGALIKGELEYIDKGATINLHSVKITTLSISLDKTKGTFGGTATVNGVKGFTFTVEVEDNGEPGNNDKFKITIPELSYTKSGTLVKGNIQIHK